MNGELKINGKSIGTVVDMQMPRFGCCLNPLSGEKEQIPAKVYNLSRLKGVHFVSGTLSDIEHVKWYSWL